MKSEGTGDMMQIEAKPKSGRSCVDLQVPLELQHGAPGQRKNATVNYGICWTTENNVIGVFEQYCWEV